MWGVIRLLREPIEEREFADWDMGCIHSSELRRDYAEGLEVGPESGRKAHALLRGFASRAR